MSDTELAFVATEALLDELMRRFDAALFVAAKCYDDETFKMSHKCKGDPFALYGLAHATAHAGIVDALEKGFSRRKGRKKPPEYEP